MELCLSLPSTCPVSHTAVSKSQSLPSRIQIVFQMARRKKTTQQEENVALGPQVPEGEEVFGVCHIFASFNDTFVHVTDLSGRYVHVA